MKITKEQFELAINPKWQHQKDAQKALFGDATEIDFVETMKRTDISLEEKRYLLHEFVCGRELMRKVETSVFEVWWNRTQVKDQYSPEMQEIFENFKKTGFSQLFVPTVEEFERARNEYLKVAGLVDGCNPRKTNGNFEDFYMAGYFLTNLLRTNQNPAFDWCINSIMTSMVVHVEMKNRPVTEHEFVFDHIVPIVERNVY